ncbi:MAG: hypothetical protein ABT940_09715 [Alphaproteobacteria bacterium]
MTRRWPGILGLMLALLAVLPPFSARAEPGFAGVWGNWCGPGHRGGVLGIVPAPMDELDAACMRHDFCYAARGEFDCRCDFNFLDELRHMPYQNPMAAETGRAMYDLLSAIPCAGPEAMWKPAYFMGQLFRDMVHGGPGPWEVPSRIGDLLSRTH